MSQSDDTFLVATAPRLRHRVRTGDATPATGEAAPRIPDSVPSPSVASPTMLGALRGIDPPYWVRNVPHNGNVKYRTGGFAHFFSWRQHASAYWPYLLALSFRSWSFGLVSSCYSRKPRVLG